MYIYLFICACQMFGISVMWMTKGDIFPINCFIKLNAVIALHPPVPSFSMHHLTQMNISVQNSTEIIFCPNITSGNTWWHTNISYEYLYILCQRNFCNWKNIYILWSLLSYCRGTVRDRSFLKSSKTSMASLSLSVGPWASVTSCKACMAAEAKSARQESRHVSASVMTLI